MADEENLEDKNNLTLLDDMYVKEGNDLVTAYPDMNWQASKLLDLAIANIDKSELTAEAAEKNAGKAIEVTIKKQALFIYFGLDDNSSKSKFSRLKDKLNTAIKDATFDIQKGEGIGSVFLDMTYGTRNTPDVKISLHPKLRPYLAYQKSIGYTRYLVAEEAKLSGAPVFFYKRIVMLYKQYEQYVGSNKRTKEQLDAMLNPYYDIDDLAKAVNKKGKYKRKYDFWRYVVVPMTEEISKITQYNLGAEQVKDRGQLIGVQFHISLKKDHIFDGALLEDEDLDINDDDQVKDTFLKSNYTERLARAGIITTKEMFDTEFERSMLKEVYPLYKRIASIKPEQGDNAVYEHISYIKKYKEEPDSKGNPVKYLKTAAEQYINQLSKPERTKEFQALMNDLVSSGYM
ncbi:plasmid replication initiation protein [Weissella uvarum]|uniref:RepB family plasmid replication initiator protein n=1 Tax=Weissella uvarum TaxID=1479233 RepID=UPI001960CD9C|nr:RepB family plasmid replication initiator protein [Weissella uvarum]MBM7617876.1 plasmid replication initiation protein [Weissella uvarum]MCM0596126.1 RepB family plasmid replication initiator protein [Weissella uvarum]